MKENRLIVADAGWAKSIPDWLKKEVESERLVSGLVDVLDKGQEEVGDAEACLYLLSLKQPVPHETAQIYIYLAAKLCKRQGIESESFMLKKLKDGLDHDEERELRILKQKLWTARGGKIKDPLFDMLKQIKKSSKVKQ